MGVFIYPLLPVTLSELIPIPWASIRSWLDSAAQAQASAARGTTTLTQPQLLALSHLVPFCAEPRVLPKDDHVGKLMQFAQGNRLDQPTFRMSDPVDVPHKGALQLRWHCECVLPWCGERFPTTKEGAQPALFPNKKDAKQYAAVQAMAFLTGMTKELATTLPTPREPSPPPPPPKHQQTSQLPPQHLPPPQPVPQPQQRPEKQSQPLPPSHPAPRPQQEPQLLPTSNRSVTPPPPPAASVPRIAAAAPSTPPSLGDGGSRPKRPLDSSDAHSSHRDSPLKQRQHPPSSTSSSTPSPEPAPAAGVPFVSPQGGRGGDAAAEQQRLIDAIRRLSSRLGVAQPQYRLTQNPPNFFSGHAEFPPASRVPEDVAVVRDVLGKRQARIQIATKVLAWMEREEAKRTAQTDALLQ
ncbi:uncharacterized protein LMH87_008776 [Akanthomyces muscarius]|uniref:DRBM domain-containing protein n=1 Tax=Akanthomyces muscarius TaxID=2231603 RepID=A0A9W8UPZ6_AKAMU|nr:uncharacterized protein LMH87_008776 [Akanthomyces muscarius]KAJ4158243.1 hypothetical protein LMH87_008776 [Akanthomyces muscarius]